MANLPSHSLTTQNGNLGLLPPSVGQTVVKIGVSSAGPANLLTYVGSKQDLVDLFGTGPLVDAAALALDQRNRGAVYCMRTAASTVGTVGSTTTTRTSTSTGTCTGAVNPANLDAYSIRVLITRTGTLNVGAFKYSLDGGDSYSAEITIPLAGTYDPSGTGVRLTFTPGGGAIFYEAGDLFEIPCTAPAWTNSDLATALAALQLESRSFGLVHIVGQIARASYATIFATVKSYADAYEGIGKYARFAIEGGGNEAAESNATWAAAWVVLAATSSSPRIMTWLGEAETLAPVLTPSAARYMRRSLGYSGMALAGALPISTDLGDQTVPALLPGITKCYHLDQSETLAGSRFAVAYTLDGIEGFLAEGRLADTSTGDFRYLQYGRVLDEAMRVARAGMTRYQNAAVRVRKVAAGAYPAGSIDPVDATAIEGRVTTMLRQSLVDSGQATEAALTVNRTTNIISAAKLPYNVQVTPLGYLKALEGKAGLVNPALR